VIFNLDDSFRDVAISGGDVGEGLLLASLIWTLLMGSLVNFAAKFWRTWFCGKEKPDFMPALS
jgi:hypothetical protein